MTVEQYNSQNHRYIYYVSRIRNTYGSGYSISGKFGYSQYYGYSLSKATAMYNHKAKEI